MTVFILGTVTTGVISLRIAQEQDQNMENAAKKVAATLSEVPANFSFFVGTVLEGSIHTIKDTIGCEMIIISQKGKVIETTLNVQSMEVPADAVKQVLGGKSYRKLGTFVSDLGNAYTVGLPIQDERDQVIGAVFATKKQSFIGREAKSITGIFLLCGIFVFAFACLCVYFISKQITKPLTEMSVAAKSYAKGDFSKRITVAPDDEMRALAISFNQMADGLDQMEEMRRAFIADVSHELRTPMTTISGFIDGILDGTIPPEAQEKYLFLVSEEVKRLSRLVTNLLDVARIQSGELTYQMKPFDILETAHRVLLTMEERMNKGKIKPVLHLPEEPVYTVGDPDAIYRVIYNLMDNAVKFTPEGGEITLGLYFREDKVFCSVKNTGKGIPEEECGKIFERFYKTDKSRGENKKGVGLGLYMVKSIIDAHNQDIFVSSQEGVYAEFTFTLQKADEQF